MEYFYFVLLAIGIILALLSAEALKKNDKGLALLGSLVTILFFIIAIISYLDTNIVPLLEAMK
jgi:hypothetical protein